LFGKNTFSKKFSIDDHIFIYLSTAPQKMFNVGVEIA